jgi:hypothetical protein
VFSLIFSFLSITKTVYDLNIVPLVSGKSWSIPANLKGPSHVIRMTWKWHGWIIYLLISEFTVF